MVLSSKWSNICSRAFFFSSKDGGGTFWSRRNWSPNFFLRSGKDIDILDTLSALSLSSWSLSASALASLARNSVRRSMFKCFRILWSTVFLRVRIFWWINAREHVVECDLTSEGQSCHILKRCTRLLCEPSLPRTLPRLSFASPPHSRDLGGNFANLHRDLHYHAVTVPLMPR